MSDTLFAAAMSGDRRALARLISIVERGGTGASEILRATASTAVTAYRVGITGAPGAGKSTLTDHFIAAARADGAPVAVLAVDPSSPFSGGAILGDRVRMQEHVSDSGVYMRSMANRGHLGGLSSAAPKALALLDRAGFAHVLVETVGVGQDEVDITKTADTTVVVVTPGWGDGIQAAKAGILEIGDLFVVNKADRAGVDDTVTDLKQMLMLGPRGDWVPPIITTIATSGEGIDGAWSAVREHRRYLEQSGHLETRRRRRRRFELDTALADALRLRVGELLDGEPELAADVEAGRLDPWTAADRIASLL